MSEFTIRLVVSNRVTIELSFEKVDDRWEHQWQLLDGDQGSTILKSQEGTKDQDWPPSPPLQEISDQPMPSGKVILGVGMAGKSHWSASFSLDGVEPIAGQATEIASGAIKADLACLQKIHSSHSSLGSTYQIGSDGIEQVSDRLIRFDCPVGKLNLEAICDGDMQTRFECENSVLKVVPAAISNSPVVASRWGYRLQFEL